MESVGLNYEVSDRQDGIKVTEVYTFFSSYDESAHSRYNMDEGDAASVNARYARQESARFRFSQRK